MESNLYSSACDTQSTTVLKGLNGTDTQNESFPPRAQLQQMVDKTEGEKFLKALGFQPEDQAISQRYPVKERGSQSFAQNRIGTLDACWNWIKSSNVDQLCSISVTINPATGPKKADITFVRVVFADDDTPRAEPRTDWALPPHIVTVTSCHVDPDTGEKLYKYHYFWLIDENGLTLKELGRLQSAIAVKYGTDQSLSDPSKKARLPGTLHLKGEPFTCRIVANNENLPRYTRDELMTAFGDFTAIPAAAPASSPAKNTASGGFDRNLPVIPEGSRNDWLYRLASGLRGQGKPPEEIVRQVVEAAKTRCNPPYPEDEALEIAERVIDTYTPNPDRYAHTDLGNSERFADAVLGKLVHNYSTNSFWYYDDGCWKKDNAGIADRYANQVVRDMRHEAAELDGERRQRLAAHARKSEALKARRAMLEGAKALLPCTSD